MFGSNYSSTEIKAPLLMCIDILDNNKSNAITVMIIDIVLT